MEFDPASTTASPIACTLNANDYKKRLGQIAGLARDALRSHERNGLTLTLRYDAAAIERVREMVRRERECCAFLEFDYRKEANEVVVTVSAPAEAQLAAETILEQFVTADTVTTKAARVALACACGAALCGAACIAPLVLPAVVLAWTGVPFVWLASAHTWLTVVGSIAVVTAWFWVWRLQGSSGQRASQTTLCLMAAATFFLALALAWPLVESPIARALGG